MDRKRLHELASILAASVLRLPAQAALPDDDYGQKISPDSGPAGLEVSDEIVLSVHRWSIVASTTIPSPVIPLLGCSGIPPFDETFPAVPSNGPAEEPGTAMGSPDG